jgi:hypothetical protein
MADNNSVNQTLDRRRAETPAGQMDTTDRLATIVADGLLVWDRCLIFLSSLAHYWAETFDAAQNSVSRTISTVQNRRAA